METIVATSWRPDRQDRAKTIHHVALTAMRDLTTAQPQTASIGNSLVGTLSDSGNAPYSDPRLAVAHTGWLGHWDGARGRRLTDADLADRYTKTGTALAELYGQYGLAVADQETLTATADHGGFFPLYYAEEPGIVWVSNSALCLARALGRAVNPRAAMALFLTARVRSPDSAFEGIRRLGYGEVLTVTNGTPTITNTWSPFREPQHYRDARDCVEHGAETLAAVCDSAGGNPVFDLTGGLDSRLVAACSRVTDVTVSGESGETDVRLARRISNELGWRLHHLAPPDWTFPQRWEYFSKAVLLNDGEFAGHEGDTQILGKEQLAETFDLAITGGMGEMLRDFFWQQELTGLGRPELDVARVFRYRFSANYTHAPASMFGDGWIGDYIAEETAAAQRVADQSKDSPNTAKLDALYIWKNSGHVGRYLGSSNAAITGLVPIGTRPVLEYALSVPFKYRLRGNLTRRIITARSPRLAALPTAYGGPANPIEPRHPSLYVHNGLYSLGRAARKAWSLAAKRAPWPSPEEPTVADGDFHCCLRGHGFLNHERLSSAHLYDEETLSGLLADADRLRVPYPILSAFASVELLCRSVSKSDRESTAVT